MRFGRSSSRCATNCTHDFSFFSSSGQYYCSTFTTAQKKRRTRINFIIGDSCSLRTHDNMIFCGGLYYTTFIMKKFNFFLFLQNSCSFRTYNSSNLLLFFFLFSTSFTTPTSITKTDLTKCLWTRPHMSTNSFRYGGHLTVVIKCPPFRPHKKKMSTLSSRIK